MNYGAPSAGRGSARTSERLRPPPTPPTIKKNRPLLPNFPLPPPPKITTQNPRKGRCVRTGARRLRASPMGVGGGGGGVAGGAAFGGFWSPFRSTAESGERPKRTARLRPHSAQRRSSIWVSLGFFFLIAFFFFPIFSPSILFFPVFSDFWFLRHF